MVIAASAMAATRKLQGEIDRCLKKVSEGVETFEDIWQKVHNATNTNQKEKYETDLKKEIKKLQRLRDQIKSWIASGEIKDKSTLVDTRKLIETQMERFKVVERETKTKAYSKEGLGATQKLDPTTREREDLNNWLVNSIDQMQIQMDQFESEIESLMAGKKKRLDKEKQDRLDELKIFMERHKFHMSKLETLMRMLDNLSVDVNAVGLREFLSQVKKIKDDIEYYLESSQESEFEENEFLYDDIEGLEEQQALGNLALTVGSESELLPEGTTPTSTTSGNISPVSPIHSSGDSSSELEKRRKSSDDSTGSKVVRPLPLKPPTIQNSSPSPLGKGQGSTTTSPSEPTTTLNNSSPLGLTHHVISHLSSLPCSPTVQAQAQAQQNYQNSLNSVKSTSTTPFPHFEESINSQSQNQNQSPCPTTTTTTTTTAEDPIQIYNNGESSQFSTAFSSTDSPGIMNGGIVPNTEDEDNDEDNTQHSIHTQSPPISNHTSNFHELLNGLEGVAESSSPTTTDPIIFSSDPFSLDSGADTSAFSSGLNGTVLASQQQHQFGMNNGMSRSNLDMLCANSNLVMAEEEVQSSTQQTTTTTSEPSPQQPNVMDFMRMPATTTTEQMLLGRYLNESGGDTTTSNMTLKSMAQDVIDRAGLGISDGGLMNEQQQRATMEAHIPPLLGVAPLGPVPLRKEHHYQLQMLEAAHTHLPVSADSERMRQFLPRNPFPSPTYYPQQHPLTNSDSLEFFQRLSIETLFFIFYYLEGTKAQYLAAKVLKKQSWRFHTKYMMWFQRHEEPKVINEDYEQGTYIYFDIEKWGQRKKDGFVFEYRYLEDRELS